MVPARRDAEHDDEADGPFVDLSFISSTNLSFSPPGNTPITPTRPTRRASTELSPINANQDLSRLSGNPFSSDFNFAFSDSGVARPESPTGHRRPAVPEELVLSSNSRNSNPFSTPTLSHGFVVPNPTVFEGGVFRPRGEEEEMDPPPAYSKYAPPNYVVPNSPDPGPAFAGPSNEQVAYESAHVRAGSEAGLAVTGWYRDHLDGHEQNSYLRGSDASEWARMRDEAEAGRKRQEERARRGSKWRGQWFCPAGGCCGFGLSPDAATRRSQRSCSRRQKIIVAVVLVVVFIVALLAGIFGSRRKSNSTMELLPATPTVAAADMATIDGMPALPMGTVVMRPRAQPGILTTCISPPSLWSCQLPPDSNFPVSNATGGEPALPEFRFEIKVKNETTSELHAAWLAIPDAPTISDYKNMSSVDEIEDLTKPEGEETRFVVSLRTTDAKLSKPNANGEAPGKLLPDTVSNQPLRLFDRGLVSEHYGFHIYYQKTIHVPQNYSFSGASDGLSDDELGGVTGEDAGYRVGWNQARFRVAIYTNDSARAVEGVQLVDNAFPLPMEVWEDRASTSKGKTVTRWELDEKGRIGEQRGLIEKKGVLTGDRGCYCRWTNFREAL